jgi:hypothetical protein
MRNLAGVKQIVEIAAIHRMDIAQRDRLHKLRKTPVQTDFEMARVCSWR